MTKAEQVIELIAKDGISMRKACDEIGITPWSFLRAVEKENLAQHYARSMGVRADIMFEEMLEIADTPVDEMIRTESDEGMTVTTKDALQHRRLQVDTRKWILSRMNPAKYGDKIETTINTQKKLPDWMTEGDE